MTHEPILKQTGVFAKLYIILFVLIMYSGSTFLSSYVMPLICALFLILFGMAKVHGVKKGQAFAVRDEAVLKGIMLAIVVFLLYQLTYSYHPNTTRVFVERFVAYSLLFWIVASPEMNYRVIQAIRWYSFPVAVSIILTTLIHGSKSGGLVGNFQFAGMMMSISFGVFLINYYFKRKWTDLIGLILCILALLTSGKRSFTAIAVFAYFLVFLLNNDSRKRRRFFWLSVVMAAAVVLAYCTVPAVRLVVERVQEYAGDNTYNGRAYFWASAKEMFSRHPIKGIGMGCFSDYFDAYFHRTGNMEAMDAHNVYIQMSAELGIIGLILFFALFAYALIVSLRLLFNPAIRSNRMYMYVLVYSVFQQMWFLIYSMTGNPLYGAGQCFFYMAAIAMMISLRQTVGKENRIDEKTQ